MKKEQTTTQLIKEISVAVEKGRQKMLKQIIRRLNKMSSMDLQTIIRLLGK